MKDRRTFLAGTAAAALGAAASAGAVEVDGDAGHFIYAHGLAGGPASPEPWNRLRLDVYRAVGPEGAGTGRIGGQVLPGLGRIVKLRANATVVPGAPIALPWSPAGRNFWACDPDGRTPPSVLRVVPASDAPVHDGVAHYTRVRPGRGDPSARARASGARRHDAPLPTMPQTPPTSPVLQVNRLGKRDGGQVALRGLGFALARGSFAVLPRPNGAGKSTLFQVLAGPFAADEGEVEIGGHDVRIDPAGALRRVGIIDFASVKATHRTASR